MLRSFSGAGKTRWEETSCMQTPGSLVSQPSGLSSPCLDQALHTATSTGIKVKMMLFIFDTSDSTSNCYCLCFCGSVVQTFSFCFHPNLAVQLGVNLFVNLGRKYLTKGELFLFISPHLTEILVRTRPELHLETLTFLLSLVVGLAVKEDHAVESHGFSLTAVRV